MLDFADLDSRPLHSSYVALVKSQFLLFCRGYYNHHHHLFFSGGAGVCVWNEIIDVLSTWSRILIDVFFIILVIVHLGTPPPWDIAHSTTEYTCCATTCLPFLPRTTQYTSYIVPLPWFQSFV